MVTPGTDRLLSPWKAKKKNTQSKSTSLALFVTTRLEQMEMRQSEFCRVNRFDQGLLSKIQNSMISNLSLESVLKLAIGLSESPKNIFILTGRIDLHELVTKAYHLKSHDQ